MFVRILFAGAGAWFGVGFLPVQLSAQMEPERIFASSGQAFAQGLTSGTPESIRESRRVVYFQEDLSDLVLGYANYYIGTTGENNTGQGDTYLRCSLEYEGQYYSFTFDGNRTGLCADGATIATDPLPVEIEAGSYGAIRLREEKVNPTVSNVWLWSCSADPAFNEGRVFHSDPDRDWTHGGAPGEDAEIAWTIDTSGKVSVTIVNPGSGITSSGVTIGILDTERTGSGFSYIATTSGGGLAGWYSKNGGSGYSSKTWLSPTGMGGYGAGGVQQSIGPAVLAGTPKSQQRSVLLLGDSITSGYGSTDSRGDIWRNFGIYARALSGKYNVCNAAKAGLTAYACDLRYDRTRALIAEILDPQIVMICLGTNDIEQGINDSGSKTVEAALSGHLVNIANWWRQTCNADIWFATILPRVSISGGNQTPLSRFGEGEEADHINDAFHAGTLFPQASRIIDGRALVQDPANHTLWRTDLSASLTNDGTHPNDAFGIPWIANNLLIKGPLRFSVWTTDEGLAGDEAAPDADPDGDLLDNLAEFAFGGDPVVRNPELLPTLEMIADAPVLTFARNAEATGYQLDWLGSADLMAWESLQGVPEEIGSDGSSRIFHLPVSLDGSSPLFVKGIVVLP